MTQTLHIWVDGQCFQTPSATRGIGRYVQEFLASLAETGKVRLTISLNANIGDTIPAVRRYLEREIPGCEIAIWYGTASTLEAHRGITDEHSLDQNTLVAHINRIAPDVALFASQFEGQHNMAVPVLDPVQVQALTACIFYDAIPYRFPAAYLPTESLRKPYMRRQESIALFDVVMAISDFSAREYCDIHGKNNVFCIGAGLSDKMLKLLQGPSDPVDVEFATGFGKYVLYVGGLDWRKNLSFVVRALSHLPECHSGECKFVIAGGGDDLIKMQLVELWEQLNLPEEGLVFPGYVSNGQLASLYRHAVVTVQPSLMEGFGLSALEAMAAGGAVLAASGGAVNEVVGDSDLLFNPSNAMEFTAKLRRLIDDPVYRASKSASGTVRAEQFRWETCANTAIEGLQRALQARNMPHIPESIPSRPAVDPRLVMDVTVTTVSRAKSGIQRVMIRTAAAMRAIYRGKDDRLALSYCSPSLGLYEIPALDKSCVNLAPEHRLAATPDDYLLYLDSSWIVHSPMRSHVFDAMVQGQEVVHGIYDLGPITMPALTSTGMPPAFAAWVRHILGNSTGLLCISRAVADEVYELIKAIELPRPMKIGYFRLGADFADVTPDGQWLSFLGKKKTFLMVGTIEPRKGQRIVLEAFERLWREGADVNLLIIGKSGWNVPLLMQRLENHPEAEKHLFVRTNVNDSELAAAYEAAEALIMASYLEGFGLPVVEAGNLGCPVIAPDLPVFREVGNAAPSIAFFRGEDPTDLLRCLRDAIENPMKRGASGQVRWPNWIDSARDIREVLFEERWTYHYEPPSLSPITRPSDIGQTVMTRALMPEEQGHSLRYVEGPLLSESKDELWFVVGLRNDSSLIWSSVGEPGGSLAVNLGAHIYGEDGICLAFEQPRVHIPFVLCPGQEILVPVRVGMNWLAQGAQSVGLEMVQEGVAWFGEAMRLDLRQPRVADPGVTWAGKPADLHFECVHQTSGSAKTSYFLTVFNTGSEGLRLTEGEDWITFAMLDSDGMEIGPAQLAACFDALGPNGQGFLCVNADTDLVERARWMRLQTGQERNGMTRWMDLSEGAAFTISANQPHDIQAVTLPSRTLLDIDSYDDLDNHAFICVIYQTLLNRSADEGGLNFYKWALNNGRLNRIAAVRRIAHDNDLAHCWDFRSEKQGLHGEITIQIAADAGHDEALWAIEQRLQDRVPEPHRTDWLAGKMSLMDIAAIIEKQWDGHHSRLHLYQE